MTCRLGNATRLHMFSSLGVKNTAKNKLWFFSFSLFEEKGNCFNVFLIDGNITTVLVSKVALWIVKKIFEGFDKVTVFPSVSNIGLSHNLMLYHHNLSTRVFHLFPFPMITGNGDCSGISEVLVSCLMSCQGLWPLVDSVFETLHSS